MEISTLWHTELQFEDFVAKTKTKAKTMTFIISHFI